MPQHREDNSNNIHMLAHVSNTFTVMNITTEASFLIILSSLSQQTSMNDWREEVRKKVFNCAYFLSLSLYRYGEMVM